MRLIDKDDLLVELGSYHIGGLDAIVHYDRTQHRDEWTEGLHTAWRVIDDAITIDPAKHGRWIFEPKDAIEMMFTLPKCSLCGSESSDVGNYCPNCGAFMKGEQDEAY